MVDQLIEIRLLIFQRNVVKNMRIKLSRKPTAIQAICGQPWAGIVRIITVNSNVNSTTPIEAASKQAKN